MSEAAKIFALPEVIIHNGQEYKLSPITLKIEGEWEQWLEQQAMEALRKHALRVSDPRDLEHRILKDIAAGEYAYGGEQSYKSEFSPKGRMQMLFLRLRAYQPKITMDTVREIFEQQNQQIIEALRRLESPNSTAPEEPQAANPGENASSTDANSPSESSTPPGGTSSV